jgi:hypothetical protein
MSDTKVITHHSHFSIQSVTVFDNVVHMVGKKADLIRMAYTLGMELKETFFHIVELNNGTVITDNNNPSQYIYKSDDGAVGMIAKHNQDGDWYLQISREVYEANFSQSFNPVVK